MADVLSLDSRVSPEGRVVIPAPIRRALGLHPGDRVTFVLDGDGVRLLSARVLADLVWSNNPPPSTGDAAADDVRAGRADDLEAADAWLHAPARDARTEEQVTADVLEALGLDA
jgi:AbrB family looped-hinge helix DNA binding protein